MANEPVANKKGMGGSRAGRGRSAKTAVLKESGKKSRREEAKNEIKEERGEP